MCVPQNSNRGVLNLFHYFEFFNNFILEGLIYTADAKLGFDDNAKFRQKAIFDMEDTTESDPREVEAASFNLNYVQVRINQIKSFLNAVFNY